MDFVADNFVHRDYLNLLPDCWWSIEADGSVQFECDGHRWPEELSKRFFMNAARKYAKKILSGEEKMWCEECGNTLSITNL